MLECRNLPYVCLAIGLFNTPAVDATAESGSIVGWGTQVCDLDLDSGFMYVGVDVLPNSTQTVTVTLEASGLPDDDRSSTGLELDVPGPNPFLHGSKLVFALPRGGRIQLLVYDLNGRRVKLLADGDYPRGAHAVEWNGKDDWGFPVPAGVYLARLRSNDQVVTRKLIVVR